MRDPAAGAGMAEEAEGICEVRRLDVTDPATFDLPSDLRVLVNNAGIDTDYLPVEHANIDDWRRMFETNVFGVVALTSAAIPTLAGQPTFGGLHGHVLVDHRLRSLLLRLQGLEGGGVGVRRQPAGRGRAVRDPCGRDPPGADRHRHVPPQHGEQGAARFERLPPSGRRAAASLRREHADPRVVDAGARGFDHRRRHPRHGGPDAVRL